MPPPRPAPTRSRSRPTRRHHDHRSPTGRSSSSRAACGTAQTLYDLYGEAYTPYEWHRGPVRAGRASAASPCSRRRSTRPPSTCSRAWTRRPTRSPRSRSIDLPLIERVARAGQADDHLDRHGQPRRDRGRRRRPRARPARRGIALLHCVSAYPAPIERRQCPHRAASRRALRRGRRPVGPHAGHGGRGGGGRAGRLQSSRSTSPWPAPTAGRTPPSRWSRDEFKRLVDDCKRRLVGAGRRHLRPAGQRARQPAVPPLALRRRRSRPARLSRPRTSARSGPASACRRRTCPTWSAAAPARRIERGEPIVPSLVE